MPLRRDFQGRSVTQVGAGDFIKVKGQWKRITSNTAAGAERTPHDWTVRTEDGGSYGMWDIQLYAKDEDFD